jgi:hypothetical protein
LSALIAFATSLAVTKPIYNLFIEQETKIRILMNFQHFSFANKKDDFVIFFSSLIVSEL